MLRFVAGSYFYYGPDDFLTSRSYPAGYVCTVGGYLVTGIVLCVTPASHLFSQMQLEDIYCTCRPYHPGLYFPSKIRG